MEKRLPPQLFRLSPIWLIAFSVAFVLILLRVLPSFVQWASETLRIPPGRVLQATLVLAIGAAFVAPKVLGFLAGALEAAFNAAAHIIVRQLKIERYILPTGERDLDGWISEGLLLYGSPLRNIAAGAIAGAVLPWLTAAAVTVYLPIGDPHPESWLGSIWARHGIWGLFIEFWGILVASSPVLAVVGALFAACRRGVVRLRIRAGDTKWWSRLYDSRIPAIPLGMIVYALFALTQSEGVALFLILYAPLWVAFGILFSVYIHSTHARVHYFMYLRDWPAAARAAAYRLADHLEAKGVTVTSEADGRVHVSGFPRSKGTPRIRELVMRVPGVDAVTVDEIDSGPGEDGWDRPLEILTVYVRQGVGSSALGGASAGGGAGAGDTASADPAGSKESGDAGAAAVAKIRAARRTQIACILPGAVVLPGGILYVIAGQAWSGDRLDFLSQAPFWFQFGRVGTAGLSLLLAGWLVGTVVKRWMIAEAQSGLPDELASVLGAHGVELQGFRRGRIPEEVHVRADLTRDQAIAWICPVAARYGVSRIRLATRAGEPH